MSPAAGRDFTHSAPGSPERIASADWTPADHLALADQHVIEGEARCVRQAALIVTMWVKGQDVREAEGLLAEMEHALTLMREHQTRLQAEQRGP